MGYRVKAPRLERLECRISPKTKERLRLYAKDNNFTMSEAIDRLIWNAHVSKRMRRDMSISEANRYYHKLYSKL